MGLLPGDLEGLTPAELEGLLTYADRKRRSRAAAAKPDPRRR